MRAVINIPDDWENSSEHPTLEELEEIIVNGKLLPKGHGDLVDYEELKNNAREYGAYAEATLSHIKPKIIIKADKEE